MSVVAKQPSTSWIVGWKAANIFVADPTIHRVQFASVAIPMIAPYHVEDTARCWSELHPCEVSPGPDDRCKCGFNSWESPIVAQKYLRMRESMWLHMAHLTLSLCLLRVGVYGLVSEGVTDVGGGIVEWGYRGSHQRVLDVFYQDTCYFVGCDNSPVGVGLVRMNSIHGWTAQQVCGKHAHVPERVLDPELLGRQNNVNIHYGYPSD